MKLQTWYVAYEGTWRKGICMGWKNEVVKFRVKNLSGAVKAFAKFIEKNSIDIDKFRLVDYELEECEAEVD